MSDEDLRKYLDDWEMKHMADFLAVMDWMLWDQA